MSALRRATIALSSLVFAATAALTGAVPVSAATPTYLLLTGSAAAGYTAPADLCEIFQWTDEHATDGAVTFTRYQQNTTATCDPNQNPVPVDGAQITVVSRNDQNIVVAGKYANNTTAAAKPQISPSQAISIVSSTASSSVATPQSVDGSSASPATYAAKLMLNPVGNRLFYRVTSARPGDLVYTKVDAATGAVIESWSGIAYDDPAGTGRGVKGDLKQLDGTSANAGSDVLTSPSKGAWTMRSLDTAGRFFTTDNGHQTATYLNTDVSDADNIWSAATEKAAVDAQYYAALTDNYYVTDRGFDLPACLGGTYQPSHAPAVTPLHSVVHYGNSYANAFWDENAEVMAYGDGDGKTYSQMSGAQDVVSHELTHAVTSCRAGLDYLKESGALNEAFSDIMGTAAEWEMPEDVSSNCKREAGQALCPDWWLGEDLIIGGSDHAIRSLADPELLNQPSHWSQRIYASGNTISCKFPNSQDQCGVHTNSGIANQAFYLTVHGGVNARCSGTTDTQADCDVSVPGIPMDDAAHIYFDAWQLLTSGALFCQARDATVAMADVLYPDVAHHVAADLGWRAVGVGPCQQTGSAAVSSHSLALQPGGSGSLILTTTSQSEVTFDKTDPTPATATFQPSNQGVTGSPVTVNVVVPADAPPGRYPMTITATDTQQVLSVVVIVDTDAPTAAVGRANFARLDTVSSNGHVPLHLSWTSADTTTGVATGSLSVDSTQIASGASGTTMYSSLDGPHHVVAVVTDQAGNDGSSAPRAITQASFQENASAVTYTKRASWSAMNPNPGWGTSRFSKTAGATATLTFNGTDVAWVAPLGPKKGKAKVYIDGVLKATVDLRAASGSASRIVFIAANLAAGQHTIKIQVLGTTGRPRVDIDGFVVLNQ